jgi:hypothetical protein
VVDNNGHCTKEYEILAGQLMNLSNSGCKDDVNFWNDACPPGGTTTSDYGFSWQDDGAFSQVTALTVEWMLGTQCNAATESRQVKLNGVLAGSYVLSSRMSACQCLSIPITTQSVDLLTNNYSLGVSNEVTILGATTCEGIGVAYGSTVAARVKVTY